MLSHSLPRPSAKTQGILAFAHDVRNCFAINGCENPTKLDRVSGLVVLVAHFTCGQGGFKKLSAMSPVIVQF